MGISNRELGPHRRGNREASVHPKKLRGRIERPLFDFVLNLLSASFSSLPFSWLPLFLFSLPFFMENVQWCFTATS
jgi:hypothetical protein